MKCDNCEKREAKFNFQKVWTVFRITKNEGYERLDVDPMDIEEPVGDDNHHLCRPCATSLFGFSE